jgi:hypothetical protein
MSGIRSHNFREGDRSEYLAVYLLSRVGLVTQVPRQEDIGFDLICNVADQESDLLSFNHHYAVTLKSDSTPTVELVPPISKKDDRSYTSHYEWLFRLELPLFLGVVDKESQKISLYSMLPAWFVFHEIRPDEIGIIEFVPYNGGEETRSVGRPVDQGPDARAAGRKRFTVDLGYPIMVLDPADLRNNELLACKKKSLRKAIELGGHNSQLAKMGTPYHWWFNLTLKGGFVAGQSNPDGLNGGVAWEVGSFRNVGQLARNMAGLGPGLMASALLFKAQGRLDLLGAIKPALLLLPEGVVPPEIKEELPEIFAA